MAKKKFDYANPKDGDDYYFICEGEVDYETYLNASLCDRKRVNDHNFFRTYDAALEACEKMKELFKEIQQEEKEEKR